MVRTVVRSFLLLSLLVAPIYAGPHAYFGDDVRDAVLAVHESKPGCWSAEFNKVCEMMKRGEVSASSEELKRVIEECMKELSCHNSPEARALMTTMEAYRDALKSGAAIVNEEDVQQENQSRRKKCKSFNRLVVRCLLNVLGDATIAGNLSVGGTINAGSLNLNSITTGGITVGGVTLTGAVLGYGYAATATPGAIADDADAVLPLQGPSSNVTYGTSTGAGTSLILPAGTYALMFTVSGVDGITAPIAFQLYNNTAAAPVPNSQFNSNSLTLSAGTIVVGNNIVNGSVLATFAVPTAISLRNVTGAPVTLANATGITGSNLASIAAIRLA